jgi:hypothetical protein
MQPVTTNKAPPTRARAWIPLVSLVATVAIAAALLWLLRPRERLVPAARATAAAHGSYHNRAVFRRTPGENAGAASAERPAIRGNVYDVEGTVLAGATVVATTFDLAGNVPSTAGSARSDAEGRFVIPLPEGTYMLSASMPGYGPTGTSAQSGDTVSLLLPRSGVIQGHVRDGHGQPVQRFTIDIVSVVPGDAPSPPPAWSKTFESRDGSYRADQIPLWPVVVRAVADDHAPAFSDVVTVHASETQNLDLALGDGCTLSGTVQDKQGAPLSRVLVNAEERITAGSAMDPSLQTSTQAQSGDDGSFTLEHVPLGTVLVRGYDGDFAVTTVTIPVSDCAKLGKVLLVMSTGGTITGVARRADGTPLAGARLSITERSIGFVNTTSGSDGRFRFDAVPTGSLRLELEQDGQRAMRYVEVKSGEAVTQDMTLFGTGNGELHGRVTARQKPIAGARLMVASNHGRQQGIAMYFPVTGADGSFRVPSIPEGNYLISVMSTNSGRGVQVRGGDATTVDIDASPATSTGDGAAPAPPPRGANASP